jgi:hypothetical protein
MRSRKDHSEIPAILVMTTVEKSRPVVQLCSEGPSLPPLKKALAMNKIPVPTNPLSNCTVRFCSHASEDGTYHQGCLSDAGSSDRRSRLHPLMPCLASCPTSGTEKGCSLVTWLIMPRLPSSRRYRWQTVVVFIVIVVFSKVFTSLWVSCFSRSRFRSLQSDHIDTGNPRRS